MSKAYSDCGLRTVTSLPRTLVAVWCILVAQLVPFDSAEARRPRPALKAKELVRSAWESSQRENRDALQRDLGLLGALLAQHPHLFPEQVKAEVATLLRTVEDAPQRQEDLEMELLSVMALVDPFGAKTRRLRTVETQRLAQGRSKLAIKLSQATRLPLRFLLVTAKAKEFSVAFREGAQAAEQTLADARSQDPRLAGFIDAWLQVPKSARVFVTASRLDDSYVQTVREQAESEGMATFSYRRCVELIGTLCTEKTIGAFFGSAGQAVHIDSPGTRASEYIPVEVALIDSFRVEGPALFVYDVNTVKSGSTIALTALTVACSFARVAGAFAQPCESPGIFGERGRSGTRKTPQGMVPVR